MKDVMYEIPSRTDVHKCIVTKEAVKNKEELLLVTTSERKKKKEETA
jgi:ATP-dependent Clp protease ATP-binding subunit ClpX